MTHPLLTELLSLELPIGDYALFGSGPLLARGWLDEVGDLDVLARGEAWARAQQLGTSRVLAPRGIEIIEIGTGITVGMRWAIGDFSTDELIDTAEVIAGIPCVRIEHVIAYKQLAGRPKDLDHLALIDANRGSQGD